MGNDLHDPATGRFAAKGAATGDPSKEAAATRVIPGHGIAPRSQVVVRHNNATSVGVTRDPESGRGLSAAARDLIQRNKSIDVRRYPGINTAAATDFGKPQAGPLSRETVKSIKMNAKINAAMRASSRPSPRMQPTAGQMIGAGIITKQ